MEHRNETICHEHDNAHGILHVHDLPQLYTRPSAQALLDALAVLQKSTATFENGANGDMEDDISYPRICVRPSGVPRYLTSIISSALSWLSDEERETVWETASVRLSERSGRTAAPTLDRKFSINDDLILTIHEPSMTEDSLGLKTWTSSLLLSRRLTSLTNHVPPGRPRILELGAGTGLVGMAAAYIWRDRLSEVLLTDLPEIVENLRKNVEYNSSVLLANHTQKQRPSLNCRVLDWADESDAPSSSNEQVQLIVAADPIYSADHPQLLSDTIQRWLKPDTSARFIVELPLRPGYQREREDLRNRLEDFMLVVEEGEETGYDDWEDANGRPAEVECWWSVWKHRIQEVEQPVRC